MSPLLQKFVEACEAALERQARRQEARAQALFDAELERMCERSLTDPAGRGVLVLGNLDGTYAMMLDESVPYGAVHSRKELP